MVVLKLIVSLIYQKQMTMTTVTIESEMKRRTDLVEDPKFIKSCLEIAQKMGISAKEWNQNMAYIVLFFANEYCGIENNMRVH